MEQDEASYIIVHAPIVACSRIYCSSPHLGHYARPTENVFEVHFLVRAKSPFPHWGRKKLSDCIVSTVYARLVYSPNLATPFLHTDSAFRRCLEGLPSELPVVFVLFAGPRGRALSASSGVLAGGMKGAARQGRVAKQLKTRARNP